MNINNLLSGGPAPPPSKPPPPQPEPQLAQQTHRQLHQHPQQSLPSTPVQNIGPQPFRDYSHHPQASPSRGPPQEYGAHQMPPGPYGSPQAYQHQPPYANRPAPPPLQPLSNDLRSPSAGQIAAPGPSPYRPTPTSSISSTSGGYPFPAPQQTPSSPAQRHQYPAANAYPPRDGFVQPGGSLGGTSASGAPGPSYMQGPPVPHTPPVGTPGGTHPYLQRTAPPYSTTTPTSAQSHQQYGPPFGSPVSTTSHLPPHAEHARQHSQPPTPLGPPPRQSSIPQSYAQPPSPYQQRMTSSGAYAPSLPNQMSPRLHHPQVSPSAPAPPSIPRVPSNHSLYDNPAFVDPYQRTQSQTERERSLSVSPKTRIPSLPSSAGHPGPSIPERESRPNPTNSMPSAGPSLDPARERDRSDRAVTPAKRKLEDRDLSHEELEKQDVRPPPFGTPNGHAPKQDATQPSPTSASPVMPRKKRTRYGAPPSWAVRHTEDMRLHAANFVLRKHAHNVGTQPNGKMESISKSEFASRHASPDEKRPIGTSQPPAASNAQSTSAAPQAPGTLSSAAPNADGPLGPWECCITGSKPYNEVSNCVADFLFLKVVKNEDMGEIASRNVQFEIEAKMGTLISKDTNDRVTLPVLTECVLVDNGRVAFQSNMTESQHKAFNEYLNSLVVEAFPANRVGKTPRVQIMYKHRRETDKFFELPASLRARLPACVQNRIPPKHSVKVRVTYDQTTGKVMAMIVKTRVADMDLHFPNCPFDCRISVNLEMDWDGSLEELEREAVGHEALPDRKKDRLSYTQSHYQVDLTQVTHTVVGLHNAQRTEKEHEIEIEVSAAAIIDQGRRAESGQPHQYAELVEGLVDNVRHLARRARLFGS